jgi:hypothetical protein
MKRLKNISLTILITAGAFLSAFAVQSPDPDDVQCNTPSQMFGTSSCTDEYGSVKYCKHTFWVTHSCTAANSEEIISE